jgi:hypothetical protein
MRFSYYRRLLLIILFLGFGLRQTFADQIFLTNGDRISGSLITFSPSNVQISTSYSGTINLERKSVQQLSMDNRVVVELVSGERIIGRIKPGEGVRVVIQSDILGDRTVFLDAIKDIHFLSPKETSQVKDNPDTFKPSPKTAADTLDFSNPSNLLTVQLQDVRGKGSESSNASDKPAAQSTAQTDKPKPIGQKPEDEEDIRKIFLRQNTVLLRPHQLEFETGLNYLGYQLVSSVANTRLRQFQLPLTFRFGLSDRIEGFVALPLAYAQQEVSFSGSSTYNDKFGIGDTTAGLNFDIYRERAAWPEIITTLRLIAPTGDQPSAGGLSLGSGHWAGTAGVQFIKTSDPVVLFWGFQYTHQFAARHFYNDGDHNVQPGETIGYNFGLGFAVNENVSLSSQVSGSYQWETQSDGTTVSGSSTEPVSLRAALTYRISKRSFIEPSVTFSFNNDAPNFVIGLSATRRF